MSTLFSLSNPRTRRRAVGIRLAKGGVAQRANVLLVDDDCNVRQSLQQVLTREEFGVVPAANRREALLGFHENPIDIVLLDIHLGEDSGWDTLREMRRTRPRLPVIVMSAYPDQAACCRAENIEVFMEKPLDMSLLVEKLNELTAHGPEHRASRTDTAPRGRS